MRDPESAVAIVQQDSTHEGPVPSFGENDVEITSARKVTHADVG
jgi:hypothetical protein